MLKAVTEDTDIAEGYKPIAVRDDMAGNTVISFNTETRDFVLSVSGKIMGPVNLKEIKTLVGNLNDVIEMKGRYMFIKDFNVAGEKT